MLDRLQSLTNYLSAAREALIEEPGRFPEIVSKLIRARLRHGFGPDTFFLYDLHNRPDDTWGFYFPNGHPPADIMRLINKVDRVHYVSKDLSSDKLLTDERLLAAEIPFARVSAVIGRDTATHPVNASWPLLGDQAATAAFLDSSSCPQELFSKPVNSMQGQGTIAARRVSGNWLVDSKIIDSATFAQRLLTENNSYGRLLQTRLRNHPEIERVTGDVGLSTVRVMVALTDNGPEVLAATQKLIGKEALADTFLGGTTGNLIAHVDIESGKLGICMGRKPGNKYLLSQFSRHPNTGISIEGLKIPMWDEVLRVSKASSTALSSQPLLGFDIAVTDSGPVVLEANSNWSWGLPQITLKKAGKTFLREILKKLSITEEDHFKVLSMLDAE